MHSPPPPRLDPLPYVEHLGRRQASAIELLVVHCTELPDLAMARSYGERVLYADQGTGASGHYYIERDGRCECWVPPLRIANHTRGYNAASIGVELVNLGRYPDWFDSRCQAMREPYPPAQLDALAALMAALAGQFPRLRLVAGHEHLDTALVPASDDPALRVRRKLDPGPLFPWADLLARVPYAWHGDVVAPPAPCA